MEGFREGAVAKGAEAEALMEGARRELEVVRRQAAVQSLYSAPHASYMVCLPPPLLSPTPIPPPLPKMHFLRPSACPRPELFWHPLFLTFPARGPGPR